MVKYVTGMLFETNNSGTLELLERVDTNHFKVKFIETGYEAVAHVQNVRAGKVLDPIAKKARLSSWRDYHEEFTNNAGSKFVAYAKRANKFKVRFNSSGYEAEVYIENARKGKVNDPYDLSVLDIGYLGEYQKVHYWRSAKQLWSNVMKRCYNPKDYMGYYGRAFVDSRWHCFANFLEDIAELPNFDNWLEGKAGGEPFNLDKDLKFPGNKIYSREACMFVSEYENKSAGAINARLLDIVNGRYS